MIGGGKYEKETTDLLQSEDAELAVIIVAGGKRGSGFSVAIRPGALDNVPGIVSALRMAANELEKDLANEAVKRWQ